MALACDLIVASGTAEFGLPETRRGLVANSGALLRAMRCLPLNIARELLLTGARLPAARAYDLGLVNMITAPGQAVVGALELAEQVCASSPTAVHLTLQALEQQWVDGERVGWQATARAWSSVQRSADFAEGITAFGEKRQPRWASPPS